MRRCIFLSVIILMSVTVGCESKPKLAKKDLAKIPFAQKAGLPAPSGGFAIAVGDETITSNEITGSLIEHKGAVVPLIEYLRPIARRGTLEQFKEQARGELEKVLTAKIANILLYQQAKKEAGENIDERLEPLVKAEVRKFVVGFGGDYAKAEEELKRAGMDWASFEEYKKREILSYHYLREKMPEEKPITYSELLDYHDKTKEELFTKPATIRFQLIDIEVAKVEVADPNQSRQERARTLANELSEQIRAGQDLDELAQRYRGVSFVGFSRPMRPESLEKPYDVLAAEAEKIEAGQVAGPIEAGEHIFIMKLEEKQAKTFEPFEKVQKEIEARIIFERRLKAIEEFNKKLAEQAQIGEREKFIDFCLEQIYAICRQ